MEKSIWDIMCLSKKIIILQLLCECSQGQVREYGKLLRLPVPSTSQENTALPISQLSPPGDTLLTYLPVPPTTRGHLPHLPHFSPQPGDTAPPHSLPTPEDTLPHLPHSPPLLRWEHPLTFHSSIASVASQKPKPPLSCI